MSRAYKPCKGCNEETISRTGYCSKGGCLQKSQHIKYMLAKEGHREATEELIERYTEKFNYTHECGFTAKGYEPCKVLTAEGYCKTHQHRISLAKGDPCLNCQKKTTAKNKICSLCKKQGYTLVEVPKEIPEQIREDNVA